MYIFRKLVFAIARTIHSGINEYKNDAIEFFYMFSFASIYNGLITDVYLFNKLLNFTIYLGWFFFSCVLSLCKIRQLNSCLKN